MQELAELGRDALTSGSKLFMPMSLNQVFRSQWWLQILQFLEQVSLARK
jgi:cytochrome c biogenesis protein ResB